MTQVGAELRATLDGVQAVLFDFDGPLCDVFAGMPAWQVARKLESLAGERYLTDDPLEVLRRSADKSSEVMMDVENSLVAAEVDAVSCSIATDGGLEAIRACLNAQLQVGVVSNNSQDAVVAFLTPVDMLGSMTTVVGRAQGRPWLMKPNPWPMRKALGELGLTAGVVAFVGDSDTDIEVASAVGTPCIAYANKPGKRARFEAMGALVIDSMYEIVSAADAQ